MADSAGSRQAIDRLVNELQVEGWCRPAERHVLYELARSGPGTGEIVEIGSWKGLSTIYLAAGSKHAGREHVTTIDLHPANNWATLHRNLLLAGVADWATVITERSTDAARAWTGQPIRLLYLDGDHSYEQVVRDYQAWRPFVAPGGIIAFHDALEANWPGVSEALDELLLTEEWRSYRVAHRRQQVSATPVDPVTSSIVVAQRRGGAVGLDVVPLAAGQGVFVTIRELYAQVREQQDVIQYLLAHGGALPDDLATVVNAPNPTEAHLLAVDERAELIAAANVLEERLLRMEEYALELEEHLDQVRSEYTRVAATNRVLSDALEAANPVKRWARERFGRQR